MLLTDVSFGKNRAGAGAAVFIKDFGDTASGTINAIANSDNTSGETTAEDKLAPDKTTGRLFECHNCALDENKATDSGWDHRSFIKLS